MRFTPVAVNYNKLAENTEVQCLSCVILCNPHTFLLRTSASNFSKRYGFKT